MDYLFDTSGVFFSGGSHLFSAILDTAAYDDLSLASFSQGLPSTTCTFLLLIFLALDFTLLSFLCNDSFLTIMYFHP